MEPPTLKLVMVQGPRKGETLEFRSGSTIRVGRVVRGNNVTIKDDGISSKHLLIGCESGKWILQDLDSSNGTTLNSSELPPFTPFDLSDGDTVKLGEITSIQVQFCAGDEPSQLKRNPRRKANDLDKLGSVAKGMIKTEEKSEFELENIEKLYESAPVDEKLRRGRSSKGRVLDKVVEVDKESENVGTVAEKPGASGSRKNENCLISDKELENVGTGADKLVTESVNVRITRSMINKNHLISRNLGGECGKMTRRGRGRRKNLEELRLENVQVGALENKEKVDVGLRLREEAQEQTNEVDVSRDEEIKCETTRDDEKKEGLDTERKREDTGIGSVPRESDVQPQVNDGDNLGTEQETVDFEKMTLGQWFDYMEMYLPKQIIEATEEIIVGMKKKAERVREYMIEQKKARALPIAN